MSKVNEALQHISTDLNYISQEELDSDENIINFKNGLLQVTETDTTLLMHTPEVISTIQIPCEWRGHATPRIEITATSATHTKGRFYRRKISSFSCKFQDDRCPQERKRVPLPCYHCLYERTRWHRSRKALCCRELLGPRARNVYFFGEPRRIHRIQHQGA